MSISIPGKLDQEFSLQATALSMRAQRQQLLASNIANADTPGYKAVDVDFGKAMRAALGESSIATPSPAAPASGLSQTAPGHLPGSESAYAGLSTVRTLYRMPAQPSADGNSVDMDLERANFAQNSVRYEAALKFLNDQMKTMLSAINS